LVRSAVVGAIGKKRAGVHHRLIGECKRFGVGDRPPTEEPPPRPQAERKVPEDQWPEFKARLSAPGPRRGARAAARRRLGADLWRANHLQASASRADVVLAEFARSNASAVCA
jgi:hypothetical protein